MRVVTSILSVFLVTGVGCSSTAPTNDLDTPPRKDVKDDKPREEAKKESEKKEDVPSYDVKKTSHESMKGGGDAVGPDKKETRVSEKNDDALLLLKERVARNPADDFEKLRLALLYLAGDDPVEAERHLSAIRARNSKFLPFVEAFLYRELGDHERAGKALTELMEDWRRSDGFKIGRAELCSKVAGFRRFDSHPDGKLRAGGFALIYVEPRNFVLKRDNERSILHLKYDWELFDDQNREVQVPWWENCDPNDRFDFIRYQGAVTEFYQCWRLKLPENLPLGNYRIKVSVTDATTGKSHQIYVPFYILAK